MKTRYNIEIIVTPAQVNLLNADPTLEPLILYAVANGANPYWYEELGGTSYKFLSKGETFVSDTTIHSLISLGVIVLVKGGIWIEVPTSAVDNLVDVDWPDAKIITVDEEGVETETRRVLNEYTVAIIGENGNSLLRCGYKPAGTSSFYGKLPKDYKQGDLDTIDTPSIISMYKEKWPEATLYFSSSLSEWKSLNISEGI